MLTVTVTFLETVLNSMVQCPYCDEYEAESRDSVRGHIRAKTDPEHKGKSGFENETEQVLDSDQDSSPDPKAVAEQALGRDPDPEPEQESDADRDGSSGIVAGILLLIAGYIIKRYGNEDAQNGVELV
jgi:hypothetical protein